ncbi:MAG: orotidine-5'-phosphate decarboxylase [Elusimicrobiaceae bacterium]|jgi:orotidine-5'-phosphate decarboxylase|nr:orotidine-5'-phosphate decarboxylase [Elusimicrobiaceae bacterium]MBT3955467.1 orotidine-5'-phosphate decarboxylase [Elusimicrobiaceae bacterium]MBT4008219.1 orotidine-5'-phosphate decarboxylase [Elusimicrobiaceae bacterium]MBT4403085.1 orotidine-5'-phosphate decarboxylase [Elusimicrobiaceae bacterium]MBT4439337.1 orotidine-5'-phosphate decarboxylase [Elusimicrobiaceae bacterium]
MKFENPKDRIIVALDVATKEAALNLVKKLSAHVGVFKVGKELFTACGPSIIEDIHKLGGKVFLDLKFHDIPNTVAKAVSQATKLGVYMITLHTSGGSEMLKAAAEAAKQNSIGGKVPILLGVTILTSLDDDGLKEIGFSCSAEEMVLKLVALSKNNGVSGIVCSAKEVKKLREKFGQDIILVTPGIRPIWSVSGDQKRITTPKDAVDNGTDFMVIGRPITQADDPIKAAKDIAQELA